MAFKHPLCPECIYHRRNEEVCDQCENASEFESADEARAVTTHRKRAHETTMESRHKVVSIAHVPITGMQNPHLEIATAILDHYEPTFKRMSK